MPRTTTPRAPATTLSAKASWVVPPGIKIEEIATGDNTACTPGSERAETTMNSTGRATRRQAATPAMSARMSGARTRAERRVADIGVPNVGVKRRALARPLERLVMPF